MNDLTQQARHLDNIFDYKHFYSIQDDLCVLYEKTTFVFLLLNTYTDNCLLISDKQTIFNSALIQLFKESILTITLFYLYYI